MAPITKDNISNEQIAKLVFFLHVYREALNKNPQSLLQKLGFVKRQVLKKHINDVNNLYKELDKL